MKKVIAFVCAIATTWFLSGSSAFAQSDYFAQVKQYRDSVNTAMADSASTILATEDTGAFSGLNYFGIDEKYRVMAKFKAIKNGKAVNMPTSGTRTPQFKPYGTLSFKLEGKKFKLTLYQSCDPDRPELNNYLLLAFTDLTNGKETYEGGRYLEFYTSDIKEEMMIDFNYCYNPYCAYNHKYSCVIPPAENFLNARIEAGVKKFKK
ncbi:MAG: DUF1684 domain-containing protein [Flavobacteriales bacterium]